MKTNTYITILMIVALSSLSFVSKAQELYVGTNYHPHDSNQEQWKKDIALMKDAGFKVVRMGHLAWDSYEPSDGKFNFEWFDEVMDMMKKAGIKVILDIAVRPAPIWLQHKYPSISITDANGNLQYPNHRYMEDIGDSIYQKYALRYADTLTKRYGKFPALIAFGIDNESGDGSISYSETAKKRYIDWLKKKYLTVDNLNKAWASQRWSRRINQFDEVGFPISGSISGAPERTLEFRRFISDEINQFLSKLIDLVKDNSPQALTTTNMWYYSDKKYFDYSEIAYTGKMNRAGCGYYPGNSLLKNDGLMSASLGIARIQFENTNPFWCTEFNTMNAVPNSIRKSAYASLMFGNQMICGWTWQSMHGGEEQYLEGMIDWDGITNRKYDEYKKIASEFNKIEKYGFPYKVQADVALAFSFPSQIVSYAYPEQHDIQLQNCYNSFFNRNIDIRVVEISRSALKYKLLIIPGVALIDNATAEKIREFVKNGGTAIMSGYSALVDSNNQVFAITHPGKLNDVFGIRIAGFEETESMNELSKEFFQGDKLHILYKDKNLFVQSPRFDIIQPQGAEVIGNIISLDKNYPIITSNKYGKGRAIYLGIPVRCEILNPILDELVNNLAIKKGPDVPDGVLSRFIDNKRILYLNLSKEPKVIELKGNSRSILLEKDYIDKFIIQPFEPEFVELK